MRSVFLTLAALVSLGLTGSLGAQSHAIELLGVVPASQAVNGLGFNLDPDQDWQWAAMAKAGATHARMQCSWQVVEHQTPPPENKPASPEYVQAAPCVAGFASAKRYGIQPTVVAAFGPPFHQILTLALSAPAAPGDTQLQVALVSGVGGDSLRNLAFPYDYILGSGGDEFTSRHSYQGTLMTGVVLKDRTHAVLSLASAVTKPLAPGTTLNVSEILYPSTATGLGDDPSVVAYGNYVMFLAKDMAAHGVTGDIELWNEPPWAHDPWDNRCALYDDALMPANCNLKNNPAVGAMSSGYPNFGFVANLQSRKLPPGITLTWNGTYGSGASSILSPRMRAVTGVTATQPATVITRESFHPYGNTPEQTAMPFRCLQDAARGDGRIGVCELPGEPHGQNLNVAVEADLRAKLVNPAFGVGHSVTESGMSPPAPGLEIPKARFVLRQYLAFQADGITPVEFFKFCLPGDAATTYSFVQISGRSCAANAYGTATATPALKALSGLVNDLRPLATSTGTVVEASPESLASVSNFAGTYPLSTVHLVGRRAGAAGVSELFAVWQRSFAPCDSRNKCSVWITQPSPQPGTATVRLPAGAQLRSVMNLTLRTAVRYTTSGNQITFAVSDDPVGILLDAGPRTN